MDDWILVGFVFFGSILGGLAGLYAVIRSIDRHNPLNRARRNINGRKAMATDWRKPDNFPEDWQ
jgi:hypothetical protein